MAARFSSPAPLLPEILALHGKWRPQQEAVICGETRLNWQQFCQLNHQTAHGLLNLGLQTGDRVGVVMSNGLPMLQTIMGIMAAGLVSVPINLSVNDAGLVNMMTDAQVSALVVTEDLRPRIESLLPDMPKSLKVLISEQTDNALWTSLSTLTAQQETSLPDINYCDESLINIIYSSGTTGLPKGIAHTHSSRRDWAYDLCIALRYYDQAKTLITIGLYSNITWVGMLCTLLAGGTLIIHKAFDSKQFLNTVAQEQVSHTVMVPLQYQRVMESLKASDVDVSSMRSMMSCGSPMRSSLKQQLFQHFNCGVIELYGLTEGIITTLSPEQSKGRWSSVGRPLLGTDLAIIDENNRPVAVGISGEIVSKGRITMAGYYNRNDANLEAEYIDINGDQWLRSGDIGRVDEEGFLYIVDRKKDMILSGGQNIYPQDIEAILADHEGINDVAVIAAKSQRWGETPIALVVQESDKEIGSKEILSWVNNKLGKQQRITDVLILDKLPRNPNGKILKRELKEQYGSRCYD